MGTVQAATGDSGVLFGAPEDVWRVDDDAESLQRLALLTRDPKK